MDEASTRFTPNYFMHKCRSLYVVWLGVIAVLVCMLSYVETSASALAFSQPLPTPSLSIPQSAAPTDWSTVRYGGVTLNVPASWSVYDLSAHPDRCVLFNVHAVYLGQQGVDAQCPAYASGKSEALQLEPLASAPAATTGLATAATTIADVPALIDPFSNVSHTFVVVLRQPGVVMTASYSRDPALARQILGTLHVSNSKLPAQNMPPTQVHVTSANLIPGVFSGKGFDACTAPSTSHMSAWLKSPYRAVGIYIGGANRACGDGNLSRSWVRTVSGSGWNLMPLYVGLQAPCNSGFAMISLSQATSEGIQGADDAVRHAQSFGLGSGTLITFDIENYDTTNSSCSKAVMTFLSAWTQELHVKGYISGVYSSLGSGITDLVKHTGRVQEPDTIFFARWNSV
ncbi:MAG: glycoside hydrolase domain-containing protein, partial [Ktedonobacteraceae bacterium]